MSAERYFKLLGDKYTYLKIVYLLLSFPLGIFYFVFLVTGFSLGLGLIIILIGAPILLGVLLFSRILVQFEKLLAADMLGIEFPDGPAVQTPDSIMDRIRTLVVSSSTWRGILYLVIKFPLGIASFIIVVTLLALSLGLISAPLTYPYGVISFGTMVIDTLPEALVASVLGLVLVFFSPAALTALADGYGILVKVLLDENRAG